MINVLMTNWSNRLAVSKRPVGLHFFAAKTIFSHGSLFSRLSLRFCRQLLLPNSPESLEKCLGGMGNGTLKALIDMLMLEDVEGAAGNMERSVEFCRFQFWMIGF